MASASLESRALWIGAVAYDPKVVTIWEGMRRYFVEDAKLPVEVVLFQSYEAQVASLLAKPGDGPPCIDIAWNTNLAFVQADRWSSGACSPIAMRDTDIGWMTKILAVRGGPVQTLADLRGRTLALGSRDSGHAAILPLFFLALEGLRADTDFRSLRFNSDVGKQRRYRPKRDRGRARAPRRSCGCRRGRQPVLADRAERRAGAEGLPGGNLDVATVQPLHVHGTCRPRPRAGAAIR